MIAKFNTRDTGQLTLASAAISINCSLAILGTVPRNSRCEALMVHWPAICSKWTVAWVSSRVGVNPARVRAAQTAIVKHPACAAASSSSGFVPGEPSKRPLKL